MRKVHLAIDTATTDIGAMESTSSGDGDSPVLPDLRGQIPEGEDISTVAADGAFDRSMRAPLLNVLHGKYEAITTTLQAETSGLMEPRAIRAARLQMVRELR